MREQLKRLREKMAERGVDLYLVVTDDFHASEYTGDHFKCRGYLTGFTGSAGTAAVTADEACLWTDGRYFLQAAAQLDGSGFALMRMGEPGVPKTEDWIREHLKNGAVMGFDGRTVSAKAYRAYRKMAEEAGARIVTETDLVGEIWENRPPLSAEKAWELGTEYTGEARRDKIARLRKALKENGADAIVLSSLMDINWLMNIRGNDVACTPVALCFAIVTDREARLYINPGIVPAETAENLKADGVEILPYEGIYDGVSALAAGTRVLIDPATVNSRILVSLPDGCVPVETGSPVERMRAVKNETEVANFRLAHIRDGAAVTKFMKWVKENAGKIPMTEISAAEKLEEFRREQEHYIGPSFAPIMGYGPHGAIIHYSATQESNAEIEPHGFLLSDTGGHYLEGTTDITRTYAMGPLTDEEKRCYTAVLRGHLELGSANFRAGTTGHFLDYAARKPLWDLCMDYNHGTGHGVGYVMSVHEGPQNIRSSFPPDKLPAELESGMVTSDEPGLYLEGKFGVRLENLTVVRETCENDFGRFLHFEYLTMVPWDLDAVIPEMLTYEEKKYLNDYHRKVRETLKPYLTDEENEWLAHAAREI